MLVCPAKVMVRSATLLPAPSVLTRPEGWKYSTPAGLMLAVAAAPLAAATLVVPSMPVRAVSQVVAGLALGAKLYSAPYRIHGIAVSGGEPEKTERALRIANGAAEMPD